MSLCMLCYLVFSDEFEVCPFCLSEHQDEEGIYEYLEANKILLDDFP